jgi:regulator of sigma E protease
MSDIATPGPVDPNSGQPDHHAEVSAIKRWLRENAISLVITTALVVLVCIYLDPIDTLKVIIGLGLVIFIHELGHFLAAKWCDVHVKTFSIGFGPAVPFCSYKWGETTYMVGIIPLGGYVSMVGEGETGDDEEAAEDPRSFKKKSVGARMLIISAGVIMNVILGLLCFAAAYMHGVQETPAAVGWVETGSAAWRSGLRTGDEIVQIGSRRNPFFNDIRPIVMSTRKDEQVPVTVRRGDQTFTVQAQPLREEGVPFPQLGIAPPFRLTLATAPKNKKFQPFYPGTPAADAKGGAFEPGDRVVGMSDPDRPKPDGMFEVTPVGDYDQFYRRMVRLTGKPVAIQVRRENAPDTAEPVTLTVPPQFRADLGLRMQMGKVTAVRQGGPADGKVQAVEVGAGPDAPGDEIAAVGLTGPDGKRTWYAHGKKPDEAKPEDAHEPLDPILLPLQLRKWADGFPPEKRAGLPPVDLVVLRTVDHAPRRVLLPLPFDDSFRFDREVIGLPNTPLPVPGLGLAYRVVARVVDVRPGGPADGVLKPDDAVKAVRFKTLAADGSVKPGDWDDVKPGQWAYLDAAIQSRPPFEVDLRVERAGQPAPVEVTVKGRPDPAWPTEDRDRGLIFRQDFRTQTAENVGDAVVLGAYRTVRFVREVYMNLYGIIAGRISGKVLSGPLTIATVSYRFAGEDIWRFLLFMGMISVNLAVVNFLPIPVLDGGHMVLLILEKVLGRPVPERVFAIAMYTGLALILALMVSVIVLDVRRLFFGWF